VYCECDSDVRTPVATVPWQYDVCNECGQPIEGTKE